MYKILLTILYCQIAFLLYAQTIMQGNIETTIATQITSMPAASGDDFTVPTTAEKNTWHSCIVFLLNNQTDSADLYAQAIDYEVIEFTDTTLANYSTYYMFKKQQNGANYWGTYIFNPTACREELIIQSPHPRADLNTGKQGIYCFNRLGAKAFFLSGTHRCNHSNFTSCSGTTSICGSSSSYRISDLPHHTENMFHWTTQILHNAISNLLFIQLHGFSKQTTDPYVIISNGTKHTPSGTDYAQLLVNELSLIDPVLTFKIGHVDASWTRLLGTTNVQGRFINSSNNPCNSSANSSNGQFIHLEQERTRLRNNESGWQKLATALENVFTCDTTSSSLSNLDLSKPPFKVFPNPFFDDLTIDLLRPVEQNTSLKIYDMQGRLLHQQRVKQSFFKVKINEEWRDGMYVIVIEDNKGMNAMKLLKQ